MNQNPFNINFGIEPKNNYIERINETNEIMSNFTSITSPMNIYLLTGVRGSGKTVMLSNLYDYFNKLDDWIVIELNPNENLLENLASSLYDNKKIKSLFLKTELSFSYQGLTFSIKGNTPIASIETLLIKILDRIKAKNKRVLIVIDEVNNSQYMKAFCNEFQILIRRHYPLYLLMTGLDENIYKLQDEDSLTFLYRAPKIKLNTLFLGSIAYNYQKYLNINNDTAIQLAKLTKGYPYAYQVLGYILYRDNKKNTDQSVLTELDKFLYENVYEKIYSELSTVERKILKSFINDEEMKVNDIIKKCNLTSDKFTVYRTRLIRKGLLISPQYGFLKLALPRFNEFLKLV